MEDHTDRIARELIQAALSRFEAERQEARTIIDLYLHNSVGVGEHPQLIDELCTAAKKLAEAEEAIESLQRNFLHRPDEGGVGQ